MGKSKCQRTTAGDCPQSTAMPCTLTHEENKSHVQRPYVNERKFKSNLPKITIRELEQPIP